jgi:glycosyltransferase involved in cell wall biosynthesis
MFCDAGGEMQWPFGGPWLARALIRKLPSRIVCNSKSTEENVLGQPLCLKSEVVYNPLPVPYYEATLTTSEARKLFGLPENVFVIALPGTLRPVKGHDFFIEAASLLLQTDRSYHFIISGDYDHDYGHGIRDRCAQLGISENVHFVGSVDDMRPFYCASDVVCVPSKSESFGRTVIEAFAQRRPVVASRTGGIVESVFDGQTGLLVDYGDVAALVGAIHRLRDDRNFRDLLTVNAWHLVSDRHSETSFRRQMSRLVLNVLPS